jgi:hypothetical protein
MNASGGAAAPLNDASEEFGASAPRHERLEDDDDTSASGTSGSGNNKGNTQSSSGGKASNSTHSKNELEEVRHEKAEQNTNLNEKDVQHAGDPGKQKSERVPKNAAPKEDIEHLHGKATLSGNDKGDGKKSEKSEQHDSKKGGSGQSGSGQSGSGQSGSGQSGSGQSGSGQSGSGQSGGKGGAEHEGHELESSMRHQAEKFVNLDD